MPSRQFRGLLSVSDETVRELGFWVFHCFVCAKPLLLIAVTLGSEGRKSESITGLGLGTLAFAGGCTVVSSLTGGLARSGSIFPRALRWVLKVRAFMVITIGASYVPARLLEMPALMFLAIPDFLMLSQTGKFYTLLRRTIYGEGTLVSGTAHPFASAFVGVILLGLVWALLFALLALLATIPLTVDDERKRVSDRIR